MACEGGSECRCVSHARAGAGGLLQGRQRADKKRPLGLHRYRQRPRGPNRRLSVAGQTPPGGPCSQKLGAKANRRQKPSRGGHGGKEANFPTVFSTRNSLPSKSLFSVCDVNVGGIRLQPVVARGFAFTLPPRLPPSEGKFGFRTGISHLGAPELELR